MEEIEPVRLIGVRLNNLVDKCQHQVSLFEDVVEHENSKELDKTVDKLKEKYGSSIVKKASLISVKDKKRLYDK